MKATTPILLRRGTAVITEVGFCKGRSLHLWVAGLHNVSRSRSMGARDRRTSDVLSRRALDPLSSPVHDTDNNCVLPESNDHERGIHPRSSSMPPTYDNNACDAFRKRAFGRGARCSPVSEMAVHQLDQTPPATDRLQPLRCVQRNSRYTSPRWVTAYPLAASGTSTTS